jgi:hypothetical protein
MSQAGLDVTQQRMSPNRPTENFVTTQTVAVWLTSTYTIGHGAFRDCKHRNDSIRIAYVE